MSSRRLRDVFRVSPKLFEVSWVSSGCLRGVLRASSGCPRGVYEMSLVRLRGVFGEGVGFRVQSVGFRI